MSQLKQLVELLRDETKWPEDFEWNYGISYTCALGLAFKVGIDEVDKFGLNEETFQWVFFNKGNHQSYRQVTAREIASRIERVLNNG